MSSRPANPSHMTATPILRSLRTTWQVPTSPLTPLLAWASTDLSSASPGLVSLATLPVTGCAARAAGATR
jgi:hypothetical protein